MFLLYANDGLVSTIKTLFIWDTPDPYGSGAMDKLDGIQNRLGSNYDGDLAHIVSYENRSGVAYVNTLCNKYYGFGYSGIYSTFEEVPVYSWTIMVIAHEIGHNLGSTHTHSCAWGDDGNTAID